MSTVEKHRVARTFVLITISGSLVAWDLGFELGAFDTISYRRVFMVFAVSTVLLVATFTVTDDSFATSWFSRIVLGLPIAYIIADMTYLTVSQTLVDALTIGILLTFPYALYLIARLLDQDYFGLPLRERVIAAVVVVVLGGFGLYVCTAKRPVPHVQRLRADR